MNDRTASRNSTSNDFTYRNNNNQRRFSYFYILANSSIHASVYTTTSELEGEMMGKHLSSLTLLIHNMKREYQNIFFDFTKFKNIESQDSANEYNIMYNFYQNPISTQNNNVTCYMMTGTVPTERKMVDVYDSNTPSIITSGAQEEVHMFGVSHKKTDVSG